MNRSLCFIFLVMLLAGTGCREKATISGFDSEKWKQDKKSCLGERTAMITDFDKIRLELYGKAEKDIIDILGKPDSEELYERKQRYFYYYIEPGTQCEQKNKLSEANRVQVRFNALNSVSEVNYKRPLQGK